MHGSGPETEGGAEPKLPGIDAAVGPRPGGGIHGKRLEAAILEPSANVGLQPGPNPIAEKTQDAGGFFFIKIPPQPSWPAGGGVQAGYPPEGGAAESVSGKWTLTERVADLGTTRGRLGSTWAPLLLLPRFFSALDRMRTASDSAKSQVADPENRPVRRFWGGRMRRTGASPGWGQNKKTA